MEEVKGLMIIGDNTYPREYLWDNNKFDYNNLFIEASAGAGKTETIINLIVSQLYNNVSPERIVVITFTNKATEELLNRISLILNEKLIELNKSNPIDKVKIKTIKYALSNLYKMNVSTIHHFCNVILNENSYKAKLSFNSALLEELDESKRRNYFYYKWFHNELKKTDIDIIANCKKLNDGNQDKKPFRELKKTYDALCEQFDDFKVDSVVNYTYSNNFSKSLSELFDKVEELYNELKNYDPSLYSKSAKDFVDLIDNLITNPNWKNLSNYDKYKDILFNKAVKLNRKSCKDIENLVKDCRNRKNDFEKIYSNEEKLINICGKIQDYKIINEYAIKAWNYYKNNRDRESLCNNQLIYETYKLLENENEVKDKLSKQYDVVFVDEFQDTDKYQNKFIMQLALAIDHRKKAEGINTTTLVLVGDPKQSIFRFRGADFNLFIDTKNNFPNCGLRNAINVFLPDNFRSNEYILNWINDTYRNKTFLNGYNYVDMSLPASNKLPTPLDNKTLAGVYTYNFNDGNDKFSNYAFLVKHIKENHIIYKRVSKDSPLSAQEINYKDFLIITTSHTEINNFIKAFNQIGIPTLVEGEFDLSSSSTAFNYLYRILLYVLENEHNNRLLFESDFNNSIYDINKIEKIKEDTKDYSAYGKLVYVFNNIELILDSFEECDKNMLKTIIAQVIDNISYDSNASSTKILELVDNLIHKFVERELSIQPNEDAVTIMNVHKAKGLTSEIVIVADSGDFKKDGSCKVLNDKIYLNNIKLYPDLDNQLKEEIEGEKLRLEYVASTRAKQVLIFESHIKQKHLFNREAEKYNFENLNQYQQEASFPIKDIQANSFTTCLEAKKIFKNGLEKIDVKLSKPSYIESSPSSLDQKVINKEKTEKYKRPANNIFGTIFHRTMELYVKNPKIKVADIVKRAIDENIISISKDQLSNYANCITECANATIKLFNDDKLLSKYKIIEPEYKFNDYDDTIYGKPTLMSGSIDLLLINDEHILIIDYKTNTNSYSNITDFEESLKKQFIGQLEIYKKVIGKLYNITLEKIDTKIVWLEEKDDNTIAHYLDI